ncbi:uncharacterized protein V1513DRAFT_384987 [Lipomyces chichibuensis]|uniref:uncharacterized protein n=1 Tax=Lipomyces chichibuensis TaxID=1546026 RepID=UPI0033432152
MKPSIGEASLAVEAVSSDEEVRIREIRQLILANEPDKEYEFELSFSSYDKLKAEFVSDEENEDYPRLFYDWTRHEITIVTVPSRLHEDTARAILDSIYNRAQSIIEREQIHLPADEILGVTSSPRTLVHNRDARFHIEPDGLIFFETVDLVAFKVVVEVGISQTYDSLLKKAKKWIFGMNCNIVILIAFNEKRSYSAPRERHSLTSRQVDDQVVRMRRHWLSPSVSEFGPLEFQGRTYFDEVGEGFIEILRKGNDTSGMDGMDNLSKDKYVLVRDGVNESHSVPWSAGHIRLTELIPPTSLGTETAGDLVVDFFSGDDFMDIVRHAMIGTAVERFKDTVDFTD